MRAPRSLLLLIGGAALVAGAVLAFAPYSLAISWHPEPGEHLLSAELYRILRDQRIPCERPATTAWRADRRWSDQHLDRSPNWPDPPPSCTASARWRLVGGAVLALGGAAALVMWTRQSRLGRDGEDDVSDASPPPSP